MPTAALCPACKFENAAATRFCIRCGMSMADDAAEAADLTPNPRPELMRAETAALLRRVAHESGYACVDTKAGIRVTIPIGVERKQRVHVTFSGQDDEGHDMISFITVCGEYDAKHNQRLLHLNDRMMFGAFAIKTIKGKEYFVVCANQLAETADIAEIRKILFGVARSADRIEDRLSGGKDIF
ncbi:MAG: hypothetical protein H6819_04580 [Phycisphaerales bacterium]|nr:hypothetical protein [Phycisphaerales bacterium]MCB9856476.1 hypothetical protein [Phycisphaerales bacterium]MCB9863957.1 hypothetical protein [Phycisphaerales bacterium]